ncbi:MAG TPA: DNA repair and recombination protein RadA [Candidatus Acidoferrales bacterium]|nr:DNA repair and recombination protein RadA [Candidatus Acidoferrales bacterium]
MAKEKAIKELEDLPGIGPTTAEKLKAAGVDNLDKVATMSPHELSEMSGINVEAAKKAVIAAQEATTMEYQTGDQIYEKRKEIGKISTGSKDLNEMIGGGVETNSITEAYGRFASGKSQIGFQLTVNAQLPKGKGGLDCAVLFVDTEGTFRPERIESMAEAAGLDPKKTLENVMVVRATTTEQQVLSVDRADKLIIEKNIKLIVIDSITALFRAEYIGRGALGERQQKLNQHIHRLQILADKYNLAVYITNQVMDNPGIMFGDPTTPIGGNIMAHAATTRLYMRKSKEDKRIVRLVDSPSMPEGESIIKITPAGIKD